MGILTILGFLVGRRQAILDIAASRHAIWLGLLFVLSAGLAREYDGEDLLREPWHLLIPLAASLVTSTILLAIMWLALHGWRTLPNEWRTYQSFVSLYWMTAPLAWIYAIPVERFLPAADATTANLWFLGIVATWRVVLMMRVVSVVFNAAFIRVVFPFMLFADGVLLTVLSLAPVPVLAFMGGVRLTQSEETIALATLLTTGLGMMSLPLWILGSLITLCVPNSRERVPSFTTLPEKPVNASLWELAVAALLIWPVILPFTQPAQQHRRQVEQLMRERRIDEAIEVMAQFEVTDFPPHWDPPPRIAPLRGQRNASKPVSLIAVMQVLDYAPAVPPWVHSAYREKFANHFERGWPGSQFWQQLSAEDLELYLAWFKRHPPDAEFAADQRYSLQYAAEEIRQRSPEQWERLRTIFKIEEQVSPAAGEPASDTEGSDSVPGPPLPAELPQTKTAGDSPEGERK